MSDQSTIELPKKIEDILYGDVAGVVNEQLANDFSLSIGQLARMTRLISDVFYKRLQIENLLSTLESTLEIDSEKAKNICLSICGKRLLVADAEWFGGAVSEEIKKYGGQIDDYAEYITDFKNKLNDEIKIKEEKNNKEQQELMMIEGDEDESEEQFFSFLNNPTEEMNSIKKVFLTNLLQAITLSDFGLKMTLNVRLVLLLLADEQQKLFQRDLLEVLVRNEEMVGKTKIALGMETVPGTLGNWVKDFIRFVGIEDLDSTIKKSQYLINSKNFKALEENDRKIIETVVNVYLSIKRFYEDINKKEIEDIEIFPFTEQELAEGGEKLLKRWEKMEEKVEEVKEKIAKNPVIDLQSAYSLSNTELTAINKEKDLLMQETRGEYRSLADKLEESLLRRRKYQIIAQLELLCESGTLDDILVEDERFKSLLVAYFQRNNLMEEKEKFIQNPREAIYLTHFFKFIFLERLGLKEEDGAKMTARLSAIMRSIGLREYANLAYFDMNENKFKWA